MGSEAEPEPSSTPKLPLFTIQVPMQSPERSGMLTPPLHTSASVPFRWEEEPGKPRLCTALVTTTASDPNKSGPPKCLELPPRLQLMESKTTKMPSPTTVLEGPYVGMPIFQSSSFRFNRERQGHIGSPVRGQLGAMVLSQRPERKSIGFFGSCGPKPTLKLGKKEAAAGDSFVFSSSMDMADFGGAADENDSTRVNNNLSRIGRNGSFSSLAQARSHFWATVYEGFKRVLPWRSEKPKNEGLII